MCGVPVMKQIHYQERERETKYLLHTNEVTLPVSVKLSEATPFSLRVINVPLSLSESNSPPE